jgi:hypothetical protein
MNLYWKAGIALALLVVGFLGGCSWKQRELNSIKDAYAEQVQLALQENRQLEKKMKADADSITQKYQKENRDAQKTIADLRSRIASGDLRLSVRTESAAGMSNDTGTEHREGIAYLDRGTAERLVSITERGDSAIRRLNECVDRYNSLRGEK